MDEITLLRKAMLDLYDQLCDNQSKWEDEEDSVKEEHEDLIEENDALMERLHPFVTEQREKAGGKKAG